MPTVLLEYIVPKYKLILRFINCPEGGRESCAGMRQAKVQLPALWLEVTAHEVLEGADLTDKLSAAVASGATAIVLRDNGACVGGNL